MFIQVAVPGPFLSPLSYRIDAESMAEMPVVGGRVEVPFRRKSLFGIVVDFADSVDFDERKIKSVTRVLDAEPIFSESEMALLSWASHYYHEPIGNVMQTALPKRLRHGESLTVPGIPAWRLTPEAEQAEVSKRAKQQLALMAFLQTQTGAVTAQQLNADLSNWRLPMKRFVENGWVEEVEQLCLPHRDTLDPPNHTLNAEQQAAVDAVKQQDGFGAFLLDGVTGSGKTEVYLGMIEHIIAQDKQVLVLVPEIGLTPQTVRRFEAHLQTPVAVMHSGLNDTERHCAWSLVKTNQVKVLLGTRSAIFTPFADLGLCIMDEEHDLSFKQQDGFRYSARDCLVRRAHLEKVPVVLGSATPSLETLHNALQGRYQHLRLRQRAGQASLPSVTLQDVRGVPQTEGISEPLQQKIEQHLADSNQVLLFLNRRGFAPVLMCHDCGWQAACPSCDANMTYHQQFKELRCHHCGHQQPAPYECPSCHSENFVPVGQGTERLETLLQSWYPDETVLRVDRDTTRNKGQMQALTEKASKGEAKILIGTQMLAKGHHFPKVTLVALLDIDQGLFSCDFRAAERMAQLIVQVSGRAGRAEKAGEVVIQTHQPEHPLLKTLIEGGYEAFAQEALQGRQVAQLPPNSYQILLRAEGVNPQAGLAFLNGIKSQLNFARMSILRSMAVEQNAAGSQSDRLCELDVFGPVSAPMLRRQGRYRYQLLLQANQRSALHQWLAQAEGALYASEWSKKVRWSIDIDPQEMT